MWEFWAGFPAKDWILKEVSKIPHEGGNWLNLPVDDDLRQHPLSELLTKPVWQTCVVHNQVLKLDSLNSFYWGVVEIPPNSQVQIQVHWQKPAVYGIVWKVGANARVDWVFETLPGNDDHWLQKTHGAGVDGLVGQMTHWWFLGQEAKVSGRISGRWSKRWVAHLDLLVYQGEPASQWQLSWDHFLEGGAELSASTWSWLKAEQAKTQVQIRCVVGKARAHFQPGASLLSKGSQASVVVRYLRLSPEAVTFGRPVLDVVHDQVTAHHGLAMSGIDADVLFYLQSRGFDPQKARDLLVQAFLTPNGEWNL